MKKALVLFVCAFALILSGCTKNSDNPLVGKYKGTFKTVKINTNNNQQIDSTAQQKEKTISITENPLAAGNLYMDYSVDLTKVSDNHYVCEGQSSTTASILSSLISFCGVNSDYFSNTVERMKVDAQFDGSSTLTLKITYLAEILGVEAEIGVSTFTGTKIEE